MSRAVIAALEYTVPDLEQCLRLLVDGFGFRVEFRGRHPTLDAQVATVDGGGVRINLVCPSDTGDGIPLENSEARMSQLNIAVPTRAEAASLKARLVETGAPVVERGDLFYLDISLAQQLFGSPTAVVVFAEDEGAGSDSVADPPVGDGSEP